MITTVGVYGTLRKGFGLHRILAEATYVSTEEVNIPYRMVNVGAFPALLPSEDNNDITLELYAVDQTTLQRLDLAEGVPTLYNRRTIDIDGVTTNIYVFTDVEWGEGLDPIPSGDYKEFRKVA